MTMEIKAPTAKLSTPSHQPSSGNDEVEKESLWVFGYVADNIEECTKLFRKQASCEAFAVSYLAQVYNYKPTGDNEADLTALEEIWRTNGLDDCWYTSLCQIED